MEGALRQPIGERLLLDKNPELTMLLPLVARVFPEMRILFAVRDPRDVVISCFVQQLPLNPVSVHYLTLESTAKKYARSMRAWLKIRDMLRNPWIEIRYEDMVADLEGQARKVLEFLGLPWDDVVLGVSPPRAAEACSFADVRGRHQAGIHQLDRPLAKLCPPVGNLPAHTRTIR